MDDEGVERVESKCSKANEERIVYCKESGKYPHSLV